MSRSRVFACLAFAALALGALDPLAAAADESTKTPAQILADVKRDLAKVRGYHFSGSEIDGKHTTRVTGDVSAAGRADMTIREAGTRARVILVPGAYYLNANAAFWKANGGSQGPAVADKLAGRWFKTTDPGLRSLVAEFLPKHVASCVSAGTGTLSNGGVSSVGGRRAVVVIDAGDQPGTAPGKLYVSASGPSLPLRIVQTGPTRPGGHIDKRCQDEPSTSTASDVRFSGFDQPRHIHAPKGAITLSR